MSATITATETHSPQFESIRLPAVAPAAQPQQVADGSNQEYKYIHLLPYFSTDKYPALESYEHVDPGHRALSHPNPLSFLDSAVSVEEVTPNLGTEVRGVNLATLDSDGRDQLALLVSSFLGLPSDLPITDGRPLTLGCSTGIGGLP